MNRSIIAVLLFSIFSEACSPELPPYEVPYAPFQDVFIDINLPVYSSLTIDGGHYIEESAAIKGIIIYREDINTFHAFDMYCTWEPNSACSTVTVDASGLYMIDPCCNSTFSFPSGQVSGGIAIYPLRKYRVYKSGSQLTITDEILSQ